MDKTLSFTSAIDEGNNAYSVFRNKPLNHWSAATFPVALVSSAGNVSASHVALYGPCQPAKVNRIGQNY